MKKIMLAPSLLSADFSRLAEEVRDVEKAGCDALHIDVMDGHFVPNLTIGPLVVDAIRKVTKLPLDVHLMIDSPSRYIAEFRKAGADWITVHIEAVDLSAPAACPGDIASKLYKEFNPDRNVLNSIIKIKELGAKAGISLRPKTPVEAIFPYLSELDLILVMSVEPGFGGQAFMPEMMDKIKVLRPKFQGLISVDGGIGAGNASQALAAGADILVAGSAIFGKSDRAKAIQEFREVFKKF